MGEADTTKLVQLSQKHTLRDGQGSKAASLERSNQGVGPGTLAESRTEERSHMATGIPA